MGQDRAGYMPVDRTARLGEWLAGAILCVIAAVAFAWIARSFTGERFAAQPLNDK